MSNTAAATAPTALPNPALVALIENALVYRTRTGTPALSLDEGDSLYDPRGRKVAAVGVWQETDDDPEDVWAELTDGQRQAVQAITERAEQAKANKDAQAWEVREQVRALVAMRWPGVGASNQARCGSRMLYVQGGRLCAGYVKKGGYRTWLLPITEDQAVALGTGAARLVYWTNSNRAEIVPA